MRGKPPPLATRRRVKVGSLSPTDGQRGEPAATQASRTGAGTRPRSVTGIPTERAHARIAALSGAGLEPGRFFTPAAESLRDDERGEAPDGPPDTARAARR